MHNIIYNEYPEKYSENQIEKDVINTVHCSGDGYGTDRIAFKTFKVFENRQTARQYIESIDNDFYGGYAVKFYDFSNVKENKKMLDYRNKIEEIQAKRNEYIESHSIKKQKASYIGCSSCGSKLNKDRLRGEKCPLCYHDLRAVSTLERIASYDKRIEEYRSKIEEERQKDKKKAVVKWLVKFEYHS